MSIAVDTLLGRHIRLTGAVQGGGWRPRIAARAQQHRLVGWVANTGAGLEIVIAGSAVAEFEQWLRRELPGAEITTSAIEVSADCFSIRDSLPGVGAWPPLDRALCRTCRAELLDSGNRRYRDPFISCADCGPRYTVLQSLPYDRERTAWVGFPLCSACQAEYQRPGNRRYHVQGISCPQCGPRLQWIGADDGAADSPLLAAAAALRAGGVVAVQGLGGFHLLALASSIDAVSRIRKVKQRPTKPLAVMFADLRQLSDFAQPSALESQWLSHSAAPIVLVAKRSALPELLAPGSPWLGAMLAYSALHLLLCREVGQPLVVTSANRSGEPIAWQGPVTMSGVDGCLWHNRPILRPTEDPVMRIAAGRPLWLRLGRGVAPLRMAVSDALTAGVLGLGAQQKNAAALSDGRGGVWLNGHGADLETMAGEAHGAAQAQALCDLQAIPPHQVVEDAHPDYATRHWWPALPRRRAWHHPAHLAAVAAEAGIQGRALGLAWDGTGYGEDGSIYGGEAYCLNDGQWRHCAGLWPLDLPGGEQAIREPWRVAYALCHAVGADPRPIPTLADVPEAAGQVVVGMLKARVQTPQVSSMGRLFDGWAALLGLGAMAGHDAAAAMALEYQAQIGCRPEAGEWLSPLAAPALPWHLEQRQPIWRIDWRPAVGQLLQALNAGPLDIRMWAAGFHSMWADVALELALRTANHTVVLGGGCWQNRLLLETVVRRLHAAGIDVFWPQRFPPNDGGLAYGQLAWATGNSVNPMDQVGDRD